MRPIFGKVQLQPDLHRYHLSDKRERDQGLTIGLLAQHNPMLALDDDRMLALLGQRFVVDD